MLPFWFSITFHVVVPVSSIPLCHLFSDVVVNITPSNHSSTYSDSSLELHLLSIEFTPYFLSYETTVMVRDGHIDSVNFIFLRLLIHFCFTNLSSTVLNTRLYVYYTFIVLFSKVSWSLQKILNELHIGLKNVK